MAMQYITVNENDFSAGLDSSTAESNIKEGFVQDLKNAIPDSGGSLKTRTGYITYGGGIPIRVVSAEVISTTKVRLTLDSSVTVANLSRQPVIVYGTSAAIKDTSLWTYFPKSTTDIPVVVPPYDTNPGQADIVLEQYKTGLSSKYALLGVSATALGTPINSFLTLGTDSIQIDPDTLTVNTRIVNNTNASKYFFLYYIDPVATGETYKTETFTDSASWQTTADAVPNNNFIIRCYTDSGFMIYPDSLTFDDTTSRITATFPEARSGYMVIVSAETSDFTDIIVAPSAVTTVNIEREIDGDVLFIESYVKNPANNEYTLVSPDDIQFDISQEYPLTVSFTNESTDAYTVRVVWRKGEQAARSVITVEYPEPHGLTLQTLDANPHLVVYGPDHSIIYTDGSGDRKGWVSFVDRYRTATEDRMICGLGWNSFQALSKGETLDGVSLPTAAYKVYPSLRSRVVALGTVYTGPAISNGTPRSTANLDTPDASATGTLFATNITQAGTAVTLLTPISSGTLTGSASDLGRYVTIKQAPTADLLGDFEIQSINVTEDAGVVTSISFTINIEKAAIYDELGGLIDYLDYTRFSGAQIEWGIYTDELEVEAASMLIPGDKVELYGYGDDYANTYCLSAYTSAAKNYVSLSNLTVRRQLPNRMLLLGTRNTRLIPLRPEFDDTVLDENLWLVPGDMIQIDDIATEERIRVVTTHTDITLSTPPTVTVSGGVKTVEIQIEGGVTFDTNAFKVGDLVLLTNAGIFSGEYEIDEVLSDTRFCTLPKPTTAAPGTYLPSDTVLRGSLIEITGEAISVSDDAFNLSEIKVNRRWLPIDRSDVLGTYGTSIRQFASARYTEQEFVRTVVARDSMFMTNGVDPLFKYDGRNYHLAGLPRVNPCVLVSKDSGATAKIPFQNLAAEPIATLTAGDVVRTFKAKIGTAAGFKEGDAVCIIDTTNSASANIVGISRVVPASGDPYDLVEVDGELNPSVIGNLVMADITYRYYFKFLFIDRNTNVIQSATVGSQDVVVKLNAAARVQLRLVGLPMVEQLDYSRLEVEVYRTRKNKSAPFYRIRNVEVPYPISNYIDIYDSTDDALLTDLDYTTTALTSQELSSTLNMPPKSRCITAASNRLLLGACTSTPAVSFTFTDGKTENINPSVDLDGAVLTIKNSLGTDYKFEFTSEYFWSVLGGAEEMGEPARFIFDADVDDMTGLVTFSVVATSPWAPTVGDWVYLYRGVRPRFAGWYQVVDSETNAGQIDPVSLEEVESGGRVYSTFSVRTPVTEADIAATPFDVRDVTGIAHVGANIPVFMSNINGNTDSFNDVQSTSDASAIFNFIPTLGRAVTAIMSLHGTQMLWCEYGNEVTPAGTLIFKGLDSNFSVKFERPAAETPSMRIYVNGTLVSGSDTGWITASTQFRGSRIVKSYPIYAECFDNPDAEDARTSDSIIDVNPADGEIITAMIPMIGPSTTTSSQLQGTVIVFKEKSIYAVDVERNSFEKLETNGVGAPYPNSVAQTNGGLAFASTSGVYKIDRSLRITKISNPADEIIEGSNRSDATRLQGHSFTTLNQYKLSLANGSTIVYNYERESEGKFGAWAEYTNHPVAGGWANRGELEFFASTLGRVFVNRTSGTPKDYRDDSNTGISFDVKFRPMHFGDPAIRKQVRHVNLGFRNAAEVAEDAIVSCAFDCRTDFTTLDSFKVENSSSSSISQLRFGIPGGRLNYIQMRVQNSAIDSPVEITGVTYKVAGLKAAGTKEAKESR